jgi:hypothetical protein
MSTLTFLHRPWFVMLRLCPSGDLLLQASDYLRLSRLLDCPRLHSW